MALTTEESAALAAGFVMPEDTDVVSGGDDAIRRNAVTALMHARKPTRGHVVAGDTMDTLEPGGWEVTNVLRARELGLPSERPGTLTIYGISVARSATFVSIEDTGKPSRTFSTGKINGVWAPWTELATVGPGGSASSGEALATPTTASRSILRDGITARKGGRIGTAGRGAVALRFDDAPAEFRNKVLPLLAARGLPFTRVMPSETIHADTIPSEEWAPLADACITYGGEVWNHGRTHDDATGHALAAEILGARDTLRALLPGLPIDCYAHPGGSAIKYDGHAPAYTPENWDTEAGQLIWASHGLASGYLQNSYYWPLDGQPRDGQISYSVDAYTADRAKQLVDRARDWRKGVVLMWHSNNLDGSGQMTTADFIATLDYIAAERDAGRLVVLTVSGLACADAGSDYRDDLLTVHEGATLAESFLYPQFRRNISGSTRELTATVTGTPGQTVTSRVGTSTRTHTIPAGGTLALRHPATIPTTATTLAVSIDAPTTDAHLWAV